MPEKRKTDHIRRVLPVSTSKTDTAEIIVLVVFSLHLWYALYIIKEIIKEKEVNK